jgi:uncharacterized protein YegP (UPF0339 family)
MITRAGTSDLLTGTTDTAAKSVRKRASTGKFRFNLAATNGHVIATSESYESKASVINRIESIKGNAPNADTDDQTGQ